MQTILSQRKPLAHTNRKREKTTERTAARRTPCAQNKERAARKAGYQSPIDNEQYMTTKPRLNDSGDIVTLCGVFTTSWRPQRRTIDLHVASEYDDWALDI